MYRVGLALIPWHWTPGFMLGVGTRGQNLVHLDTGDSVAKFNKK